ncbi:MAG: DUF4307 domain-containing protein [Hamadaea sp.]|uniref:DUF4307 domain-containing protein n=1 Tax=Hamadaea sp. TaxID=2024425 RepID=UPI00182B024F|nr:DUF4307 domain-containing protein [Hamadaea sp.]NUR70614.1 DUF4307 domain-containing protein [Hamadaea sp.]NUT22352.1 DUF4307 domain-containing protein [Hamadaea sp.]
MTAETTHPVFPPGRYGRQRAPRRVPRPVKATVAVVLLVIMTFVGFRLYRAYGEQDYSASVSRFTTADGAVDVEFVVRLPEGGQATCVVRARNEAGTEIGRATVAVTAGTEPGRTVVRYHLTTTGRPVTGEVERCYARDAETSR